MYSSTSLVCSLCELTPTWQFVERVVRFKPALHFWVAQHRHLTWAVFSASVAILTLNTVLFSSVKLPCRTVFALFFLPHFFPLSDSLPVVPVPFLNTFWHQIKVSECNVTVAELTWGCYASPSKMMHFCSQVEGCKPRKDIRSQRTRTGFCTNMTLLTSIVVCKLFAFGVSVHTCMYLTVAMT